MVLTTQLRVGTFPLVSGDAFAHAADHLPFERPFASPPGCSSRIWFVEASDLEDARGRDTLLDRGSRSSRPPVLVVHNGDLIPTAAFFREGLQVFDRIWSVNVIEEGERLRGIPIGLENPWHRRPDETAEYLRACTERIDPDEDRARREVPIVVSFNAATNPAERAPLLRRAETAGLENQVLTRASYRAALRNAWFVLSPPGNGPDCHRTWESIASGAVPVVLRTALAPSIVSGARIMVVDDWDEVLSLSADELAAMYVDYRSRSLKHLLMPFWLESIGVGHAADR